MKVELIWHRFDEEKPKLYKEIALYDENKKAIIVIGIVETLKNFCVLNIIGADICYRMNDVPFTHWAYIELPKEESNKKETNKKENTVITKITMIMAKYKDKNKKEHRAIFDNIKEAKEYFPNAKYEQVTYYKK